MIAGLVAVAGCQFHAGFTTKAPAEKPKASRKATTPLFSNPQVKVTHRSQKQIQADKQAAEADAEREEEEKEIAFLDARDREREEQEAADRATYLESCTAVGGDAWAVRQGERWRPGFGTTCPQPDEDFLKEQAEAEKRAQQEAAAAEKRARQAAARRAYAAGLDEWALEHGAPDDTFFTEDQEGGEPDAILVYKSILCSRQRVRKVINDLTRAKLRSLGFARVYCVHPFMDWPDGPPWEVP